MSRERRKATPYDRILDLTNADTDDREVLTSLRSTTREALIKARAVNTIHYLRRQLEKLGEVES